MIKIYFDGNEIDKDYYRSLSQSYILFDKSFCLGSVPSNTFKIELNNNANIGEFENVKIRLDNNDYAQVYYDNIDNSNGSKNIISLSDRMVDFEFNYDASSLINASENGYVTILEILEDICSKKGVTLATKDFNLKDKQITWYDSTISARKYISYITTLNGGFARINRSGELELVRYTNGIKSEVNVNTCLDYKIGEYHKITRVVWDIGVDKWEYGDETGNTLYLDTDNPFITQKEDVQSIYNLIKDFEFYSMKISKCPIDSNINIGDTIALKIGDKLYPFIVQLELNYNGGFHGGYSFIVNTEKVEETSVNETEKNIKSIKSRINRDEAQLEIIAEESTETKKNLQDLSTPIITKEGNNHICAYEALGINALEYNIEGKCEQEGEPSLSSSSEIKTIKGIRNLFDELIEEGRYDNESGVKVDVTNLIRNTNPINVEPNSEYIFSNDGVGIAMNVLEYKSDNTFIKRTIIIANNSFITTSETKYINFYKGNANEEKIQLEEGSVVHSYVPYGSWLKCKVTNKEDSNSELFKEKEVLVDMNKPNLFDKNNISKIENVFINTTTQTINQSTAGLKVLYISIVPNKAYTVSKTLGKCFTIGVADSVPTTGTVLHNCIGYNDLTNKNITLLTTYSTGNSKYLVVNYYRGVNPSEDYTEQEIIDSIKIYEGYSPYHEVCSIGETKDTLEVVNGHLEKNIGKIVLNGDENWIKSSNKNIDRFYLNVNNISTETKENTLLSTHFQPIGNSISYQIKTIFNGKNNQNGCIFIDFSIYNTTTIEKFKSWLKEQYDAGNPVVVYYELAEPQEESLTPTEVPLFEGENHITLESDTETNTSIKYYRENVLNEAYTTKSESKAQMKITSTEIENSVTSTRTELKNDLMVTNEKFNQYALQQVLVEQINSVLQKITDSEARISILNQTIKNGVPITKTETGYTFDINGLNVSSTDAEVNSTLSSIGLSILDNIRKESLLFAGYDKELQETIVRAENMIINKYLMVPHSRYEKYNNPTFGEGTGCFYVD